MIRIRSNIESSAVIIGSNNFLYCPTVISFIYGMGDYVRPIIYNLTTINTFLFKLHRCFSIYSIRIPKLAKCNINLFCFHHLPPINRLSNFCINILVLILKHVFHRKYPQTECAHIITSFRPKRIPGHLLTFFNHGLHILCICYILYLYWTAQNSISVNLR